MQGTMRNYSKSVFYVFYSRSEKVSRREDKGGLGVL